MLLKGLNFMAKVKKRRQKKYNPKGNRPNLNFRTPVKIFCDGKTEISYFKRLNDLNLFNHVSFRPRKGKEKELLRAIDKDETSFLLLDIDNHGNIKNSTEFKNLKQVINSNKKHVFFVNYSIETWILLHKMKNPPIAVKKEDYNSRMNIHFHLKKTWSSDKSEMQRDTVMSKITKSDFENCLDNSKNLENNDYSVNPSTNLRKLFVVIQLINDKEA